jgi:phosphatidate cytidylyltransferase
VIRARRVGTGLALGAAVVGVAAADHFTSTPYSSSGMIVVLCVWALWELYGALERAGLESDKRFGATAAAVLLSVRPAGASLGLLPTEARELFVAGIGVAMVAPLALRVVRGPGPSGPQPRDLSRAAVTAFGLAYIVLLGSFMIELRWIDGGGSRGLELLLLLAATVKVGDSCAYFVGRLLGRTPMCWVSPKKTWEGSAGSVLGAVATSVLAGVALGYDPRVAAGFGLVADLAGQGGDLIESYVKRALGVKDSARTFGEIGGVLDLLDALLLSAPAAFVWAHLLVARGGFD